MILSNRGHTHLFDPKVCDWEKSPIPNPFGGGWGPKFHTTPKGVIVWATPLGKSKSKTGAIWMFDKDTRSWKQLKASGDPIPPVPGDDYGTIVYDSKRDRALLFGTERKSKKLIVCGSYDMASGEYKKIEPINKDAAVTFPRESIYLPAGDLVLFAENRDDGAVVYDVAQNRFRVYRFLNPEPPHSKISYGSNACGLMYDSKRDLAWAVYAKPDKVSWPVRVLKFDAGTAKFTQHLLGRGEEKGSSPCPRHGGASSVLATPKAWISSEAGGRKILPGRHNFDR
jgi:hypothetical protein